MKMKIQKIITALLLAIAVFFTSCDTWIDTDLNIDPDSPADVPLRMLIPSIQANFAYDLCGSDAVMPTNLWMQYLNGYARQAQIYSIYKFTPADVNNLWDGIYASAGMDTKVLIDKAVAAEAWHSAGIGQVMMAYIMAITTDLYGDVPYSEAFLGTDNLTPAVDAQSDIYASIDGLLNDAIANFDKTDLVGVEGDMIHGGSATAWKKTAYALKARNQMNLSKRTGTPAAALAALANAYTSNDDNMAFEFGTASSEQSPISQFVDQRGDIVMGKFFMDMLILDADPRLSSYATLSDEGGYAGSLPGDDNIVGISFPGRFIASQSVAVTSYMMTYAECKFIEAEALLGTDANAAADAFKEGVLASIELVRGDTTGTTAWYESNINSITGASLDLATIMKQKYIANFGQVQPYNDYRRTGLPAGLATPADATVPMPLRYPYAQDEITYNPNIEDLWQVSVFLTTPVWWDN
jgi:hypothetical protein